MIFKDIELNKTTLPELFPISSDNFKLLRSNFSSDSAPEDPIIGQLYFNSKENNLYVFTISGWLLVNDVNTNELLILKKQDDEITEKLNSLIQDLEDFKNSINNFTLMTNQSLTGFVSKEEEKKYIGRYDINLKTEDFYTVAYSLNESLLLGIYTDDSVSYLIIKLTKDKKPKLEVGIHSMMGIDISDHFKFDYHKNTEGAIEGVSIISNLPKFKLDLINPNSTIYINEPTLVENTDKLISGVKV